MVKNALAWTSMHIWAQFFSCCIIFHYVTMEYLSGFPVEGYMVVYNICMQHPGYMPGGATSGSTPTLRSGIVVLRHTCSYRA